MRGANLVSTATIFAVLLYYSNSQIMPMMSPFFFMCNFHGNPQELGLNSGEVRISVAIAGNPDSYIPGDFYQVSVSSSMNFDSFLMTGLYTISQTALNQMAAMGMQARQPIGQNLMCSLVHSHMSRQPQHQFMFTWMAPPAGTGCVSFMATATLQQQLLFKDTTVLQLCEEGAPTMMPLRPDMAALNSDSYIFRDDFYSDDSFSYDHWSVHEGAAVSDHCGKLFSGNSVVMCEKSGNRELVTRPLNTTSAAVLQFILGAGTCDNNSTTDQDIVVMFGLNQCSDWVEIERIRPPTERDPELHLVHLPHKARGEGVCFAWKQAPTLVRSNLIPESHFTTTSIRKPTVTKTTTQPSTSTEIPNEIPTQGSTTTTRPVKTTRKKLRTTTRTTATPTETTTTTPTTTTTFTTPATTTTTQAGSTTTTQSGSTATTTLDYYDYYIPVSVQDEPYSDFPDSSAGANPKFGKTFGEQSDVGVQSEARYEGCWVMDNVLIVNMAHIPSQIQADFETVDPSQLMAIPGANFKHKCHANGTAMVFDQSDSDLNSLALSPVNVEAENLVADALLYEEFETKNHEGWVVEGGYEDVTCGEIHRANALVFNSADRSRKLCTPFMDTRKAGNVRFYFGMGSGKCQSSGVDKASVLVYVEDENDHTLFILEKLSSAAYQEPQLVSLPMEATEKHPKARVCWLQKYNGGLDQDVWALDSVMVLPYAPSVSEGKEVKVAQFFLNLQCDNFPEHNQLDLTYSTNHGQTWHTLHEPCLPEQCRGDYFPESTSYSSGDYGRWRRVTSLLPYAALVPSLRLRLTQEGKPNWAVDDVYIGPCPEGCNYHGSCTDGVCHCDFGYTGPACKGTVVPNPTILLENFEGPGLVTSSTVEDIRGAQLSFDCDVVSSGKGLVFNGDGHRYLMTGQMNTTNSWVFQFNIRVGSNSIVNKCPPPDNSKELVILDYSCNGGVTWHLLKTFNIYEYRHPKSDSVLLPPAARDIGCQFRWWQPVHSGVGQDVWALDDLSLNSHMFNTLHLQMDGWKDMGEKLTVTHGKVTDSFCRRMKSLSFIGDYKKSDMRFLATESMFIGPGYIVQFDLVMGCGLPYADGIDNRLFLEYSSDHGIHWHLVEEPCLPPKPCPNVQQGTIYDWTQYSEWGRVTVPLPQQTWGPGTRFRLQQSDWSPTDTWAVARLYIGQHCSDLCYGHGQCNEGTCLCDEGFRGATCLPVSPLDSSMQADFGIRYEPKTDFLHIRGGKVVSNNQGCGDIFAGESLYFYDNGVRELITKDFNTEEADILNFYLRIGGGDRDCQGDEERTEGIVLQYSNNGGIDWTLLEELLNTQYRTPRRVMKVLPDNAKTPNTRFRWWQPSHSGKGTDQWAVDEIHLTQFSKLTSLEDDFDNSVEPIDSGMWHTTSDGLIGKYCMSGNPTLVLANSDSDKMVITKDMQLTKGDVIQFKINVGCSNQFRWDHPVLFQFIHPEDPQYRLVQEPCYQEMDCHGNYTEGSIYYSGTHGHWELVVIPVTEELANHPVSFRWWQKGGYPYNFALNDVYIGPPCTDNCHRNGACKKGSCACDLDIEDPTCQSDDPTPYGMVDRFEQLHRPSDFWSRIRGGHLGLGCGAVDRGNALFFDGEGTREAVTVPLNTTFLRMLEFVIKIGSDEDTHECQQPQSRNEGIVVQYSTDNEITWHLLKMVEPLLYAGSDDRVVLDLPSEAKTDHTIFKWFQPLGYGGMLRADWGLDSVTIGVNETNLDGFQDDFAGMMPDMFTWFQTESAVPRITCQSKGNALEFSRKSGTRYAETWDYHVTPSTFLQFDIAMGCDSLYGTLYGVMLEYSNNMGKTWQSVTSECTPPNFECSGYHLSSDYMSDQHQDWTRITVPLPPGAVSPVTRFRWKQHNYTPSGSVWALDNVYLGAGCPWLCSGHGYCTKRVCLCDEGYEGEYCVPSEPLPMMLRDDFNREEPLNDNWIEIYGGALNTMCGTLASGNALTFSEDQLRMAVTRDIDTTMLQTVEFYFLYGCNGEEYDWPRKESVLLQYSNNGGITWNLIKELHYRNETGSRFFSLELPQKAHHNSTRFRFWQAANGGKMRSTWAIDNLFLGRMAINPSMMEEDFDTGVQSDSWLFVNDGVTDSYCESNTRDDTPGAGQSALVFKQGLGKKGEHSIVTRDLDVGPMSVLQFDINVGCASSPTHKFPVRLEYSSNGGKTWQLVVQNCAEVSSALCYDSILPTTLYYGGASKYWRRIIIPLDNLYVCGSLRFRWYQGFISEDDFGPEWAIDNVFVGMACMGHCLGQGDCSNTMMCSCDQGYHGDFCEPDESFPNYLKEAFVLVDESLDSTSLVSVQDTFSTPDKQLDENKWDMWSGGVISPKCGLLSLYFAESGERSLVTRELDLSKATSAQFYLRLGCKLTTDPSTPPVYLQYTTNGGVNWHTIEQFDFNANSNKPFYVVLNLPASARSPASQLRWYQPSKDGTFMQDWAIDQIYIGGNIDGEPMLSDQPVPPKDPNYVMTPGALIEPVCGSEFNAHNFKGPEKYRYGVTADVVVEDGTFLQFDLSMGCSQGKKCFSIDLEYSLDKGTTWKPVFEACYPSNVDCNKYYYTDSSFRSDMHYGWNTVNIPLPYYLKSKATRFRWQQAEGFDLTDTWAISNLYVGNACPGWCHGNGKCLPEGGCICDKGWTGDNCEVSVEKLSTFVYDMFTDGPDVSHWDKVGGAQAEKVCQVLSSGDALHFMENCTRSITSKPLDLSTAAFVQFYFMYGCLDSPDDIDESVLIAYSSNGVTWVNFGLLHYRQYRKPTFVSLQLPEEARHENTKIGIWQMKHSGYEQDDWVIDNLRIGGNIVNPESLVSNFSNGYDPAVWFTMDNMEHGSYCDRDDTAIGNTLEDESSMLTTQDLSVKEGHMLQFWYNIGCMHGWNVSVAPVHLQFSTDNGVTWSYLTKQCLPHDPTVCPAGESMASVYYGDPMGRWQRVIVPMTGMTLSSGTRFRWQQKAVQHDESISSWAVRDIYIGPQCELMCNGHGSCLYQTCTCDEGYGGKQCYPRTVVNPTELKDVFTDPNVNKSKWSLVQGGNVQDPCFNLVEGTAMVMSGPGRRQLVTVDMDLRDAKFVQYYASIGGNGEKIGCVTPTSRDQSVILQYSTDGGISWDTLHTLDYASYGTGRRDYLVLPQAARTRSTRVRWWQPLPPVYQEPQPTWSVDNVYIGGNEINLPEVNIDFKEDLEISDQPWEFNPYGQIETEFCQKDDSVILWREGSGERHFTSKQTIVQAGYILQFKIAVGCSQSFNSCVSYSPITLQYNKNPILDDWSEVLPMCLPDLNQRLDCRPNMYHMGTVYTPDTYPRWTRVTISLPEKTFSSTTRFRWMQNSPDELGPGWALDDIYVGQRCQYMCNGRGDCKGGTCHCDEGYQGESCMPATRQLTRMFDSFEGGIFKTHWDWVSGGDIGFGCGALLPYAHGKTLYFNGCGLRQARTVEMDLRGASKVMFVIQIGCQAQTPECNVKTDDSSHYRGILLQYTTNHGADWILVARHDPADYLNPKRLAYDIPKDARVSGAQFRWWQPVHGGEGHDQWALDHVEIVPGRNNRMGYRQRRSIRNLAKVN